MKQIIKIIWQKFKSWLHPKPRLVACAIVAGIVIAIAITFKVTSTTVLVLVALVLADVIRNL